MKRRCKGTSIRLFMQKIIVKNSKTTNCQGWNFRYNYHYQLDRTNKKFICSQYDNILSATLPSRQTAIWQFIDADVHCFIVRFRQFGLSDGFDFCSVQRNLSVKWYNWNTFPAHIEKLCYHIIIFCRNVTQKELFSLTATFFWIWQHTVVHRSHCILINDCRLLFSIAQEFQHL